MLIIFNTDKRGRERESKQERGRDNQSKDKILGEFSAGRPVLLIMYMYQAGGMSM